MLYFASMPLQHGLGLAFVVTAGLLLFVGWVFWKINPPRF
jgi:hypothetical protein